MTNPNDPIYPQTVPVMVKSKEVEGALDKVGEHIFPGLTKREYFAIEITKALIISAGTDNHSVTAMVLADALIAELNKS